MGGCGGVPTAPLTTKTDTASGSKKTDQSSQKTTVAQDWKSTKSNVTASGDFPSLLPLFPEFNDLHVANLNRIYSPHCSTNLTFFHCWKQKTVWNASYSTWDLFFFCSHCYQLWYSLMATSRAARTVKWSVNSTAKALIVNHHQCWTRKYHAKIEWMFTMNSFIFVWSFLTRTDFGMKLSQSSAKSN